MEIVLWSIALFAFSALSGITLGRRARTVEIVQISGERDRLKALLALTGERASGEDFHVQKQHGACPTCGGMKGDFPPCAGRCARGNKHVHVKCATCGFEWVRVV